MTLAAGLFMLLTAFGMSYALIVLLRQKPPADTYKKLLDKKELKPRQRAWINRKTKEK